MNLTKKNISKILSRNINLAQKDSEILVNSFINIIKNNLDNKEVKIHNFGTFFFKRTTERIGRNPKTGLIYKIKPFKKVVFRASSSLKNKLN